MEALRHSEGWEPKVLGPAHARGLWDQKADIVVQHWYPAVTVWQPSVLVSWYTALIRRRSSSSSAAREQKQGAGLPQG